MSYIICVRQDVDVIFNTNDDYNLIGDISNDKIFLDNADYNLPGSSGNHCLF